MRIKWQDDLNREIKEYREYHFQDEKFKKEQFEGKPVKCIVLAKYKHDMEEAEEDLALF